MSELSAKEREDYLFLLYFGGSKKSVIGRCVGRAYRDLCRTLRGMSRHDGHSQLTDGAHKLLEERLKDLLRAEGIQSQADFDSWHKGLVAELCSYYTQARFERFSAGQAQK